MKDIINLIEAALDNDAVQLFITIVGIAILVTAVIGVGGYMDHLERLDKIAFHNATNNVQVINTNK